MWIPVLLSVLVFGAITYGIWADNVGLKRCKKCGAFGKHEGVEKNFYYFTYRCRQCGEKFHS